MAPPPPPHKLIYQYIGSLRQGFAVSCILQAGHFSINFIIFVRFLQDTSAANK